MALAAPQLQAAASLSGAERAAVLVMYLQPDVARSVLANMNADELRDLGLAMSTLQHVDSELIEQVVAEFVSDLADATLVPRTGTDFALRVLPDLVAPGVRTRLEGTLRRRISTEFVDFVSRRPATTIAAILREEHPQTRAVALLLMGPDNAARVMKHFPTSSGKDLVRRMAAIKRVPGDLADDVERTLRAALADHGWDAWEVEGVQAAAKAVGRLDGDTQDELLLAVEETAPELCDEIRRRMVVFDDLGNLADRAVQALLKQIDRETLKVALRGALPPLRDMFLRNLSKRAAADLIEEIELLGPVPRARVERAREEIVQMTLSLADSGVIELPTGNDEMM